jgi:hypothetical protein
MANMANIFLRASGPALRQRLTQISMTCPYSGCGLAAPKPENLSVFPPAYYALHRCRDDPLIVNLKYLRHFNNYCLATSDMIN